MTDYHTHILPRMDDGAASTEESVNMLIALGEQGVKRVMATPHYSQAREPVKNFLKRRDASLRTLTKYIEAECRRGEASFNSGRVKAGLGKALHFPKISDFSISDVPEIVCGAEVVFYETLSELSGIEKLCLGDTDLILIEMPSRKIESREVKALINFRNRSGLTPVIAHVERFAYFKGGFEALEMMLDSGILLQMNMGTVIDASKSSFNPRQILENNKTQKLLKSGCISFLGSDCHNLTTRLPNYGAGVEALKKIAGEAQADELITETEVFFDSRLNFKKTAEQK